MKESRPPYIDHEIYQFFKDNVKKRKNGRIRDTLKEELEKAILFYDICGKDLYCLPKDKMVEHLHGVEWKVVVDVDGTKEVNVIQEFKDCFKNVYRVTKPNLQQFIREITGKSGNYTYRKYSSNLINSGYISYDHKSKAFFVTQKFMDEVNENEINKEDAKSTDNKASLAKKEADDFFKGII